MIHSFSTPDESLARKILGTVPFKERFPAGRLKPPVGIIADNVRSLPELHMFLAPNETSLPGINLAGLPDWIERNMGDAELAEAIKKTVASQNSFVEGCQEVYAIVGLRVDQARRIIGEGSV